MTYTDIIVIIAQCFWGICEFIIKRKMTATEENADKVSYKVLYTITIISLIIGISVGVSIRFINIWGLYHSSIVFPVAGVLIMIAGLIIRLTAISTLKSYFTVNVTIKEDHQLITNGLYKYIRHPAYAGGIMSFIGCGLCYGNIISFAVIALPYFILILIRIKYEEKVLISKFGKDYIDLQSRTKELIPFIF